MWSFRFIMERVSLIVDPIVSLKIRRIAHGFAWWDFQFYATQWCKTSTDRLCKVGWGIITISRIVTFGGLGLWAPSFFILRVAVYHTTPLYCSRLMIYSTQQKIQDLKSSGGELDRMFYETGFTRSPIFGFVSWAVLPIFVGPMRM